MSEKDERFFIKIFIFNFNRYRYLIKHGTLKKVENNGNIIFSELP